MGPPQPPHPTQPSADEEEQLLLPMAVSGMANSVFSVATRNLPCTDRPTPCRAEGRGGGVETHGFKTWKEIRRNEQLGGKTHTHTDTHGH